MFTKTQETIFSINYSNMMTPFYYHWTNALSLNSVFLLSFIHFFHITSLTHVYLLQIIYLVSYFCVPHAHFSTTPILNPVWGWCITLFYRRLRALLHVLFIFKAFSFLQHWMKKARSHIANHSAVASMKNFLLSIH